MDKVLVPLLLTIVTITIFPKERAISVHLETIKKSKTD